MQFQPPFAPPPAFSLSWVPCPGQNQESHLTSEHVALMPKDVNGISRPGARSFRLTFSVTEFPWKEEMQGRRFYGLVKQVPFRDQSPNPDSLPRPTFGQSASQSFSNITSLQRLWSGAIVAADPGALSGETVYFLPTHALCTHVHAGPSGEWPITSRCDIL